MSLFDLVRSASVRRWHANPEMAQSAETNGHHQWVVASIVLYLHPQPSSALVREALWHDVGELRAGDLSAPFKDANPEFATAHAAFEAAARERICGPAPWLTPEETRWLRFADRLASCCWMLQANHRLSGHPEWSDAMGWIGAEAEDLGCNGPVAGLLADLQRGWR